MRPKRTHWLVRPIPRPSFFDASYAATLIVTSIAGCTLNNILARSWVNGVSAIPVVTGLLYGRSCRSLTFGHGRPFYYVRQWVFALALALSLLCAYV